MKHNMHNSLGVRPLYQQVYEQLIQRIAEGYWKPAQSLPSEFALANELGVSQGTVRKALTRLEAEHVVERHRGKGTVVTVHTNEASNFRFFRLVRPDGTRLRPQGEVESVKRREAQPQEARVLELDAGALVVEIRRLRIVDNTPCVAETVVVPAARFPDIDKLESLTESLYPLYQREFGIHIAGTEEKMRAVAASKEDAKRLGVSSGTPLLQVDRVAFTIHKNAVECRSSLFDTRQFVYATHE